MTDYVTSKGIECDSVGSQTGKTPRINDCGVTKGLLICHGVLKHVTTRMSHFYEPIGIRMDLPTKKTIHRTIRITPDLDRKLAAFKRKTGISKGRVIREGIAIVLEKYAPLMLNSQHRDMQNEATQ